MEKFDWLSQIHPFDERRNYIIPGNEEETIRFSALQFLQIGQEAIAQRGHFYVALSGGSTPHAIYKKLSQLPYREQLDWSRVICFWSDERSVPPTDPESNFFNAMQAGFAQLHIPHQNFFRMEAEKDIEEHARIYDQLIQENVPHSCFDLMMLGMGEDGHTGSLFPQTHGLHTTDRLVVANYVPQKQTWRMSVTYQCIHQSRQICIYVTGAKKRSIVDQVLLGTYQPNLYPVQKVGTPHHQALWILDQAAGAGIADVLENT